MMDSSDLRKLDIDDLIMFCLFAEGKKSNEVAKKLQLTPSAICFRKDRFQYLWKGRGRFRLWELNEEGRKFALKCKKALEILNE